MITGAKLYKNKAGKWTTDISGDKPLLLAMTERVYLTKDGTWIGRWHWDSWEAARHFVFGPICMIPDCGCDGGPHP